MTTEEAIRDLELIKAEAEWEFPMNWQESLDMAISALQERKNTSHCSECDEIDCDLCGFYG